jgi:translation initiation factor 5B
MLGKIVLAFNEQGWNVRTYWEGDINEVEYLSFVPTSAHTGEGMCDLMTQLIKMGQGPYRERLEEKDVFECTVLEVKVI